MAENYRDPKVTTTDGAATSDSGGMGKMIMYAVIALLALLVLAWLLGWFGGDDVDAVVVPAEDGAVVVDDAVIDENEVVVTD